MFLKELRNRERRTLISHRNEGFGDNLLAAANAWYYAKLTQRDLMIAWSGSRYLRNKKRNAFTAFFTLPDTIQGVRILTPKCIDRVSSFIMANIDGSLHPFLLQPIVAVLFFLYRVTDRINLKRLNVILGLGAIDARINRRRKLENSITLGKEINSKVVITNGCFGPHERLRPFFDALQLVPGLRSLADEFAMANFHRKKVIGVHIRYYNQNLRWSGHTNFWLDPEMALKMCEEKINEAIYRLSSPDHYTTGEWEWKKHTSIMKAEDPNGRQSSSDYLIFLTTNSAWVHDAIKRRYENVITYEKSFGSHGSKEMHVEVPVETATASAIEMFLLAKTDIMVRYPPESWFSHYASLYVKEIIV